MDNGNAFGTEDITLPSVSGTYVARMCHSNVRRLVYASGLLSLDMLYNPKYVLLYILQFMLA